MDKPESRTYNVGKPSKARLLYRVPLSKFCLVCTLQLTCQFSLGFNEAVCSTYMAANEIPEVF